MGVYGSLIYANAFDRAVNGRLLVAPTINRKGYIKASLREGGGPLAVEGAYNERKCFRINYTTK